MLSADTTWGDLRRIRAEMAKTPLDEDPDDLLRFPSVAAMSIDKLDSDPYFEKVDDEKGTVKFYIVEDLDADTIVGLLKVDPDEDSMESRIGQEWESITHDNDEPYLDMPYLEVTGEAVPIWDGISGAASKYDFQAVLLDGV